MKQPNRWSCLPTAFALATGHSVQWMFDAIGHDGSEIVWPDLPEPQCRRAFHIQECIFALLPWYNVTPLSPVCQLSPDGKLILEIKNPVWMQEVFDGYGVATGMGVRNRHAVAYIGNRTTLRFKDPNGMEYDFENQYFTPETYWMISEK